MRIMTHSELYQGLANLMKSQIVIILGFVSVMATFMCHLDRTRGCPGSWENIISGCVWEGIFGRDYPKGDKNTEEG